MNNKLRRSALLVAATQGGIDIDNYLTIVALEDGLTASLSTNAVEYCIDGDGNWTTLASGATSPAINKGQTLSFRGSLTPASSKGVGTFTISKSCDLTGNCNSLLFRDDAKNNLSLSGKNYAFYKLFYNCTTIKNVSPNFLPATMLSTNCYNSMFYGCKTLTTAPALPTTTLAYACYRYMFSGCSSLTTAPALPATTLTSYCYNSMFYGCTSLTTSPALPATTLVDDCYNCMFYGCTSLTTSPELPATTLKESCYKAMFGGCTSLTTAPALPATTLANYCYESLFKNCSSLTTTPALPATTLAKQCYASMFGGCTSLTTAPALPAKTLKDNCYSGMFQDCSKLTTTPALPATTLAKQCYQYMFSGCSSLTTTPALPATILASGCYNAMLSGTNLLPDCSNINFSSSTVVTSGALKGLFYGTKVTDSDLRSILPINSNGKYYLPCTTLASNCYEDMFYNCTSLTTAPELPATTLKDCCYYAMFYGCTSLTTAPALPATTLAYACYGYMFCGCRSLTTAPALPAKTLKDTCYYQMFFDCSKLNYIKALFTTTPSSTYTYRWVYHVASSGTFIKSNNATWNVTGESGIPSGWTVDHDWTLQTCVNLSILADNVSYGNQSTTTIHYTALCEGVDEDGIVSQKTLTGDEEVEIGQNKTTSTVQKTVSFTYLNKTATTTITQGPWVDSFYTVNLNSQWQKSSTISNPNISTYDGVYESYSNKGTNSSGASMYIDINGYTNFKLYIRSYAESNYDYVMVSQLDKTLTYSTSYSNTTLVKAHTRGNQKSGTTINDYTLVEFTNIPSGTHRIQIIYRKDSSGNSGDDRGYVLIPRNQ